MERMLKSQVAKILLLSLLLLIPFISTSLRSSYLYFLLNLLIIVLGVEAGLLASVSKPRHDESKMIKPAALGSSVVKEADRAASCRGEDRRTQEVVAIAPPAEKKLLLQQQEGKKKKKMMMEIAAESVQKLKRCRSRPSIFFIGSCDEEEQEEVVVLEEKVAAVVEGSAAAGDLMMSKQELFMKAEMFIGNFYKQLKMQREESWKKIHGLYHRAF